MLTVKGCSEAVIFRMCSKQVFHSLYKQKKSSYDDHHFFQNGSNLMEIPETEKQNEEKFFVFKVIAFESVETDSHNPKEDTCHWQSMCYETPLKFNTELREIFSKSGSLRVMKKYDESALMLLLQEIGSL